jgi:carnitine 3-dehydrogenase
MPGLNRESGGGGDPGDSTVKGADGIRSVGIVGAGTVGASWAAFFLSRGLRVSIHDPDATRAGFVGQYIAQAWPVLQALGPVAASAQDWTFSADLQHCVRDVQFVQESAPDDFELKRRLFTELDRSVAPCVPIASSTSSLLLSDLQQGLTTAARFVVAHPLNPPHLIPVVEIVAGRDTSAQVAEQCARFFERLGKSVVRLHKEVCGHLINRLQAALFREAVWLVREGVASVADVDRGIAAGAGLRWACMGPFLTFHLGAGSGGIRDYLRHLGPAHERIWRDLQPVDELTPELIEEIARGMDGELKGVELAALVERRDRFLTHLIRASGSE